MKKRLKKTLALFLSLLLLLTLFPAGLAAAEDEPMHALLSDFLDFLYRTEQNDSALLWALDYTETALDTNEWSDVLKARLAVSAAAIYVEATELAEDQTDEEMGRELQGRKIEAEIVRNSRMEYAADQASLLNTLLYLDSCLESGVFSKQTVQTLKRFVQQNREDCLLDLEYQATVAAYLLRQTDDADLSARFRETLEEACPLLSGFRAVEEMTSEELEAYGTELMEKLTDLTKEMQKLTTRIKVDSDELNSGGLDAVEADWNEISGLSVILPFPIWDEKTACSRYFCRDEDGAMSIPKPGSVIESLPSGCILTYTGVEEAAVHAYAQLLADCGVNVQEDSGEDGVYEAACSFQGILFMLSWEDGVAELIMPDGIPCLIL